MRSWILALFVILVACQQNPYNGKKAVEVPRPVEPPKPKPLGAYSMDVPELVQVDEGTLTEFYVRGTVPVPGSPVVTFTNLPAGMNYDSATQKMSWTPSYQDADNPQNLTDDVRLYQVRVDLFSSEDKHIALTRFITVAVKDNPRGLNILSPLEASGRVGVELVQTVRFEDLDYPNGPFYAALDGMPTDVRLEMPNHAVPEVTLRWTSPVAKTLAGQLILINPKGKAVKFELKWTIQ